MEHSNNTNNVNVKNLNSQYVDVKTFSKFTNKIENLLKNMMVCLQWTW